MKTKEHKITVKEQERVVSLSVSKFKRPVAFIENETLTYEEVQASIWLWAGYEFCIYKIPEKYSDESIKAISVDGFMVYKGKDQNTPKTVEAFLNSLDDENKFLEDLPKRIRNGKIFLDAYTKLSTANLEGKVLLESYSEIFPQTELPKESVEYEVFGNKHTMQVYIEKDGKKDVKFSHLPNMNFFLKMDESSPIGEVSLYEKDTSRLVFQSVRKDLLSGILKSKSFLNEDEFLRRFKK